MQQVLLLDGLAQILACQTCQCLFALEALRDGSFLQRDRLIALARHLRRLMHPVVVHEGADVVRWQIFRSTCNVCAPLFQ